MSDFHTALIIFVGIPVFIALAWELSVLLDR